jgi:outer membrane protein OmpA-like peptidoglycan-associated protein
VLSGLVDQAGARFSGRVLMLAVSSLDGLPPVGELGGADVLVLTPFVPRAGAAAAAQQNLIAAGAARAAVLGPEAIPAELDQIVTDGLGLQQVTETVSGPALFANDSTVLRPAAARVLAPLVARLERPGVTAVVNGYASAPGSAGHNQQLSENRAAAVAGYLEAHGVSAAALFVVGHGASNFVAPGSSGDNRRVVVVIEQPTGGA